jgi:hypothetical protein
LDELEEEGDCPVCQLPAEISLTVPAKRGEGGKVVPPLLPTLEEEKSLIRGRQDSDFARLLDSQQRQRREASRRERVNVLNERQLNAAMRSAFENERSNSQRRFERMEERISEVEERASRVNQGQLEELEKMIETLQARIEECCNEGVGQFGRDEEAGRIGCRCGARLFSDQSRYHCLQEYVRHALDHLWRTTSEVIPNYVVSEYFWWRLTKTGPMTRRHIDERVLVSLDDFYDKTQDYLLSSLREHSCNEAGRHRSDRHVGASERYYRCKCGEIIAPDQARQHCLQEMVALLMSQLGPELSAGITHQQLAEILWGLIYDDRIIDWRGVTSYVEEKIRTFVVTTIDSSWKDLLKGHSCDHSGFGEDLFRRSARTKRRSLCQCGERVFPDQYPYHVLQEIISVILPRIFSKTERIGTHYQLAKYLWHLYRQSIGEIDGDVEVSVDLSPEIKDYLKKFFSKKKQFIVKAIRHHDPHWSTLDPLFCLARFFQRVYDPEKERSIGFWVVALKRLMFDWPSEIDIDMEFHDEILFAEIDEGDLEHYIESSIKAEIDFKELVYYYLEKCRGDPFLLKKRFRFDL